MCSPALTYASSAPPKSSAEIIPDSNRVNKSQAAQATSLEEEKVGLYENVGIFLKIHDMTKRAQLQRRK